MDFDVLPGPSLPELARTTLARATAATVSTPGYAVSRDIASPVPVRARRDGSPLLLTASGSVLQQRLAAGPGAVAVTVPASPPFRALRLTGTARPVAHDPATDVYAWMVALRSVAFHGTGRTLVGVDEYTGTAPDPLWQVAPGVLRHLEHAHTAELVSCVRAHGITTAEWVVPRGLDRFGLELLVLTPDGAAAVRLTFPDGPVDSLQDVPASVRTTLTCRCHAGPDHRLRR
jgi:hypothetical protein